MVSFLVFFFTFGPLHAVVEIVLLSGTPIGRENLASNYNARRYITYPVILRHDPVT